MKKLSVILASLVLALGLVFAAACKEEGEKEQPLEGTYTFESLTYTGDAIFSGRLPKAAAPPLYPALVFGGLLRVRRPCVSFFLLFRVGCAILCMLSNRIVHSVGYIGIDVPSFFLWNER